VITLNNLKDQRILNPPPSRNNKVVFYAFSNLSHHHQLLSISLLEVFTVHEAVCHTSQDRKRDEQFNTTSIINVFTSRQMTQIKLPSSLNSIQHLAEVLTSHQWKKLPDYKMPASSASVGLPFTHLPA